jgi:hypothetical protein
MNDAGIAVGTLHGGKTQAQRSRVLKHLNQVQQMHWSQLMLQIGAYMLMMFH